MYHIESLQQNIWENIVLIFLIFGKQKVKEFQQSSGWLVREPGERKHSDLSTML